MYYVIIVLQLLPYNQWACAKTTITSTYFAFLSIQRSATNAHCPETI